ncbi:MAG TPA: PilZ domain-containing protein [Thermoanaerobaculia bacterium]|nr:PilZ domain-containing protein [Thermoanaerobaculia bacterium]
MGGASYLERDREPGGLQRRFHRVGKRRPVVLQACGGEDTTCSFVRLESVGRGGVFLRCERPVPVGTEVTLAICLAGGVIRARGRVVYQLEEADEAVGLGVEFLELLGDGAELLEQLLAPEAAEPAPSDPSSAPA